MATLRSVLYLAFLFATVILYSLPLALFGWFVPYSWIARVAGSWGRLNLAALERICGLRYRIQGWENLPQTNCIICAKHQSAWETIAFRGLLPPEQTWVLKRELLWAPFFGWGLAVFRPIAIDRNSGRKAIRQLLDEGSYWLDRGRWVVIFPEGTRVAPGQKGRYGQGGALLAKKTRRPVVPIAHNAGVFWRRRDIVKYPGTIDVVIGKPIETNALSATEINRKIEEWIEGVVQRLPQQRDESRS
jgi:1-acyl-sn-glycerol-3-phosphate acyltransferase